MSEPTTLQWARVVENTTRDIVQTVIVPDINRQVAREIEGAALRALARLEPDLIEREVRKAVNKIIGSRIRVQVFVDEGSSDE